MCIAASDCVEVGKKITSYWAQKNDAALLSPACLRNKAPAFPSMPVVMA